ncbi:MAG: trimeric intracellular cation channel family protein [Capnocytophaga sp.]|nr:trimeric intracellular cation channel family protein [Capnocytophaga sp.]
MTNIVSFFSDINYIYILDLIGTVVFAITGVLAAREHKMDIFGMFILAFVTGVGGGTLRDMMIGSTPVFWMKNPFYITMIVLGVILPIMLKKLGEWKKSILFFDAIGLGVFTVIGVEKGISFGLHPVICVALGAVTGCFGGLIRDILRNEIPAVLHKEIYATASLVGGTMFFVLNYLGFHSDWVAVLTASIVILIRVLALKYQWELPKSS